MIIYHLKEWIHRKSALSSTKIKYDDIVKETGLSKTVLGRMASRKGYAVTTEAIEKLCRYFNCTPNDLMTIAPDTPAHPAEKQPTM